MDREFFRGKKVLVMGLGQFGGGADVVRFAHASGAKVTVTDAALAEKLSGAVAELKDCDGVEFHLGGHDVADFELADIVIVNPAVRPDNEFLTAATRCGKVITTQMNIFFELCPATIIGITGSNGKSTTTALTAHLLTAAIGQKNFRYKNVWLGGNIGNRPLLATMGDIGHDDLAVLEISSFQTEQLAQILKAPGAALLTNLTPNHLDRHGTFEEYCRAKENIFRFQRLDQASPAFAVFNAGDEICCRWFEKYRRDKGRVCVKFSPADISENIRKVFPLPGRVNLENLAGAMAIARYFGVSDERIKTAAANFKALPHRLELVGEVRGVRYYNDSIATTPESVIAAIEAFEEPKIIIAGGYDKHISFDELGRHIAARAKAMVLIGQTAEKIASAISAHGDGGVKVHMADSLTAAVEKAASLAQAGDVVLLSPACASYDMFQNFQHRGRQFGEIVRQMGAK